MFEHVPQPLRYAEKLVQQLVRFSGSRKKKRLADELVGAVIGLTDCDLCQLYVLDVTHTRLELAAEAGLGVVEGRRRASLTADYQGEQLLQFSLCQNRVVAMQLMDDNRYDVHFLPQSVNPWRSVLSVPLRLADKRVVGVLLCVSQTDTELEPYGASLRQLGDLVIARYVRQQGICSPDNEPRAESEQAAAASGYGLLGASASMRQTCHMIDRVLHSPYTVLLTGETGTGKEIVARAIHDHGPRGAHAFVVQNCAALPEHLLESELFGYRKGAFTGADRDRSGLFDTANGGTLLLDEIGDMPIALQAKFLRVLQEGEVRPLGASGTHRVDVRIIAATHHDLPTLVEQGRFRADLYYRLAQFPIALPPLRAREGDIMVLAQHFAEQACRLLKRTPLAWSDTAVATLSNYTFPGNVRELKALVERAVLLCEGNELLPKHFPAFPATTLNSGDFNLRQRLEQAERGVLVECLRTTGGNRTSAARKLGVSRRTLHNRMNHLCIGPAELAS